MATQQIYIGVPSIVTLKPLSGGGTILRGNRVTVNSDGTVSVAATNVRGDFVAMSDLQDDSTYPSQPGEGIPIQQGGRAPVLSNSSNATIGATCYTDNAVTGAVNTASTSGVIFGKYMQTCAAGDLVEVLFENPL